MTRKFSEGETSQHRSVVGAPSWVTRQCIRELLHRVSKLQAVVSIAKVLRLNEANRVLENAVGTADKCLAFKGGAVQWDKDVVVLTITDAGWSGEEDIVLGSLEPLSSQKARFNGGAGP